MEEWCGQIVVAGHGPSRSASTLLPLTAVLDRMDHYMNDEKIPVRVTTAIAYADIVNPLGKSFTINQI